MPNINKTLKGINQGMQLLDTLQGGSSSRQKNTRSGSYDSYDTRSSSHSKGGLSQGLQLLGSLSGSHGQSGGGGGGLSKVLSSFTGAGGRRTSSDDREYGDRGRDRGYDRDSDRGYDRDRGSGGGGASSRRLRDECEDEISFHRRAITKLSEAKEQALRAAQAALKANADDGDRALGLLRQKEAEAARAGNQAQASALGLRAQEMELSCRSRLNKHQLAVEKNQFEFDKALQTHRQLLELLERQMGEIDRGGLPTLIRERPTTIPDPHVVPLESINTAELLGGLNVAAAAPAQAYGQQAYSAAPQQQTYSATPQQQTYSATPQQQAYSAAPQASAQPQRPPSPYLQQQQAPEQQPYGASYPAPASAGTHLLPPSMPAMPSMPSMPPMSGSPYSASQPDGYAKAPYGFPPSQSYQQQPGQQSPGIGFRM